MDNRVDELSRFIERPTTRLKETERLLARQLEVSDRKYRRGLTFAAADQGLGARQQLPEIEWLAEIVICSRIEQCDH